MFGEILGKAYRAIAPKITAAGARSAARTIKGAAPGLLSKRALYPLAGFSAAGLGASIGTGDWGYLPVGIGAGLASGISGGIGRGPFKRLVGASAIGMGAGVAGLGPMAAPVAAGVALGGPYLARGFGKGLVQAPSAAKAYGQMVIGRPFAAAATLQNMKNPYWATFAMGAGIGLGWGGLKAGMDQGNATAGYFPGGINYMPPGRGGIASDPMNTAGLTLALHKHNRSISRVM